MIRIVTALLALGVLGLGPARAAYPLHPIPPQLEELPPTIALPTEPAPIWGEVSERDYCGDAPEMSFATEDVAVPSSVTDPDPDNLARPSEMSTSDAIAAILGLLVLFALAYIAGHPRVQRFERRLGISQLVTAGFPFIVLGLIGRSQGVLSDPVLDAIRPLLPLGLGWIGFAIGFRFDVRVFDNFPRAMLEAFLFTTLLPFAMIVGSVAILVGLVDGVTADIVFVRDALILATAGAMTSRAVIGLLAKRGSSSTHIDSVLRLIQLEKLAAFVGLILLGAFFRPTSGGWSLPSVGWVFVSVGVGATLGVLIFAALSNLKGPNEIAAVMLGSICLAAGIAGFLRLSPIVVCFLAGALLVNLPGTWKGHVRSALLRIERPVYLLFLVLAGALWRIDQWEAWVLMAIFVFARLGGRFIGARVFGRRHPEALGPGELRIVATSPMDALAIAIVVSAQVLYSGNTVPWIVHTIIVGAVATEIVVHLFTLKPRLLTGLFPVFAVAAPSADAPPASTPPHPAEPPPEAKGDMA